MVRDIFRLCSYLKRVQSARKFGQALAVPAHLYAQKLPKWGSQAHVARHGAVSYTHLDVYKRQHLERSSSAILGVAEDSQSEAAPPVPKGVEAGPPTTGSDDGPESESGPQSEQPKRVFNHWMELLNADGTSTVLDNTIPLKAGSVYELKINVAAPRRTAFEHTSVQAFVDLESSLPEEVKLLDVLIVLDLSLIHI